MVHERLSNQIKTEAVKIGINIWSLMSKLLISSTIKTLQLFHTVNEIDALIFVFKFYSHCYFSINHWKTVAVN